MQRIFLAALSASLLAAPIARADLVPAAGAKYVDPRVRFLGVHKLSNYVFFLRYETGSDLRSLSPASVQVKNDDAFTLKNTGRFMSRTRLLAITTKDYEKWKNARPPRKEIDEKTLGVLTAGFLAPANAAVQYAANGPLTEYRVSISNGKLDVQSAARTRGEAAPAGPLPPGTLAGVFALSLAALGMRFAWRRTSNRSEAEA